MKGYTHLLSGTPHDEVLAVGCYPRSVAENASTLKKSKGFSVPAIL